MAWGLQSGGGKMRLLYGVCLATMLGLLAYMTAVSLPLIRAEAQGLLPFDLRATGYTEADAQAFLAALSPSGRATYLGVQHRLDTAYPPLLALVLSWTYLVLLPRKWALLGCAMAVFGAAVDLFENARVAGLLTTTAPLAADIAAASYATMTKTAVVGAALMLLAVTLALTALRWLRAR